MLRLLRVYLLAVLVCLNTVCALKGDSGCGAYLCVNATVVDDVVTYEITPLFTAKVGWIALGFGRHMAGSHMVIMWNNKNGSTTLSQRYATGHREPKLVESPPRVATISEPKLPTFLSNTSIPRYAFEIPLNKTVYPTLEKSPDEGADTREHLIWAFSVSSPRSAAPDTHLSQHLSAGFLALDLTNDLPDDVLVSPQIPLDSGDLSKPFSSHERLVIAHGVLVSSGFLIILPLGSLVARWARTFTPMWFPIHRIFNFYIALPLILVGWLLGPIAVMDAQAEHFMDAHQICGFIMLFLYLAQLSLGRYIHEHRDRPNKTSAHPPSNVLHVGFGLFLMILAFFQVRSGLNEWENGHAPVAQWCFTLWTVWAVAFPILYLLGLSLLRRQFYQERSGISFASVPDHYIALSPDPLVFDADVDEENIGMLEGVKKYETNI